MIAGGLTSAGRFSLGPPGSQIGSHKENQLVSPKVKTGLKTKPMVLTQVRPDTRPNEYWLLLFF
jgi:hypothetical protein